MCLKQIIVRHSPVVERALVHGLFERSVEEMRQRAAATELVASEDDSTPLDCVVR